MKKIIFLCIYFIPLVPAFSQVTVNFIVTDSAKKEPIFLAGSFNKWNPGDNNYKLNSLDDLHKTITLKNLPEGAYEFKFTRGDWSTVESMSMGIDIDNRKVDIKTDTTINIKIAGWIDAYSDISHLPDTMRVAIFRTRSSFYLERDLDSSLKYAQSAYELSKKIDHRWEQAYSLNLLAEVLERQGNTDKALELFLKALPAFLEFPDSFNIASVYNNIGNIFDYEKDYAKARSYYFNAIRFAPWNREGENSQKSSALRSIGRIYYNINKLDSADYYATQSYNIDIKEGVSLGSILILMGDIQQKFGKQKEALEDYRRAIIEGFKFNRLTFVADAYERIAERFYENNQEDSGFYYARNAYSIAKQTNNPFSIVTSAGLLVNLFKKTNKLDSGFLYQEIVIRSKDSLFTQEKIRHIQNLSFNEQFHQQEIAAENQQAKSRLRTYGLLAALFIFLFVAFIQWRNNKHKQKANLLLQHQKEKVEFALSELRTTQAQLIQQEKMASLGQLTAGIAHEIQNPLNFVNNFSDVNTELIIELKETINNGNIEDVRSLAKNISENEQMINHHGKRADAIVKGMLQHSRTSIGKKESTDINALADEYLRLSYHGLRAKDKFFSTDIETTFDASIGKIEIIPQDIGRVLLNLYNNAFYSVNEKKRKSQDVTYKPLVSVHTKKINEKIELVIKDNGTGIPQKILDKIFQPFFTTKPTGQGTGLGLSLSYDIVKAHGGEIKAESTEGGGAAFIITIPFSQEK